MNPNLTDHPDIVSILNETDREYLVGEQTMADAQADRDRRQRIRDRSRAALADFALLFDTLPAHDRELIFQRMVDPVEYQAQRGDDTAEDGEFPEMIREGTRRYLWLVGTLAFVHAGCKDIGLSVETVLEMALRVAETKRLASPFGVQDVTVEITYFGDAEVSEAVRTLRRGESLTDAAYQRLATLYFEDHARFVEELDQFDVDLEASLETGETLTRGQALMLLARLRVDPSIAEDASLAECLPDEVIQQFGLTNML